VLDRVALAVGRMAIGGGVFLAVCFALAYLEERFGLLARVRRRVPVLSASVPGEVTVRFWRGHLVLPVGVILALRVAAGLAVLVYIQSYAA